MGTTVWQAECGPRCRIQEAEINSKTQFYCWNLRKKTKRNAEQHIRKNK